VFAVIHRAFIFVAVLAQAVFYIFSYQQSGFGQGIVRAVAGLADTSPSLPSFAPCAIISSGIFAVFGLTLTGCVPALPAMSRFVA